MTISDNSAFCVAPKLEGEDAKAQATIEGRTSTITALRRIASSVRKDQWHMDRKEYHVQGR